MSSRNIILQALPACQNHGSVQQAQRTPVALLSGGTWTLKQRGMTLKDGLEQPDKAARVIVEVNQDIQSDIVWPGSGYHNLLAGIYGGTLKFRDQGNIDVVAPAVQTVAEALNLDLDKIDQHPWIQSIRKIITDVNTLIGKQYLIGTSSWGPFTLAGQFYGVEKMMSGLYKDQAAIHQLLSVMTEVCYRYLAPAISCGATILSIAEPTASGDLISLRHFKEFVAPYLDQVIHRLKADGALITLHICGNINDRLDLAPNLGVDLLSVDYKVDLANAVQKLAGKTALAGNVNPVLLKSGSLEEIAAATHQCLAVAGECPHYVLMPGCDVPPGAEKEKLQTFFTAGLQQN